MLVFTLDPLRCGMHLGSVDRISRIVEIAPLPQAPEMVLGVVNVHGEIIPVINIRKRFGLPERELALNSHLIIARTTRRRVALAVDAALGLVEASMENTADAVEILPGLNHVQGVMKLEDGLVLIHSLDTFLSLEEDKTLQQAMTLNSG